MKRKLKIFSHIAIICLSVCMFAFGVYAASTVSVTTSGTVTFNATDVYARVTRTIENIAEDSTYNSIDLTYNANTVDNHEDKFESESLKFASADEDIVMRFTIENLATEDGRYVYATFTETESESVNVTKFASSLGGEIAIAPGESKDVVVYMRVTDSNLSASAGYNYTITLKNTTEGVVLNDTLATFTASADGNSYILSGLKDTSLTNIIIPEEYNGKPVTEIGVSAMKNNSTIKTVTISDNITTIGQQSFQSCTNLVQFNINKTSKLNTIGIQAFCYTSSMTSFDFPESCLNLGQMAFYGSGLIELTLPNNLKTIGIGMFCASNKLLNVILPEKLQLIDIQAFATCKLLRNVSSPEKLYTMNSFAFYDCSSLKTINLPDAIVSIPQNAFTNCLKLSLTKLPNSLKDIGEEAFYNCPALRISEIPNGVTSIGQEAFAFCMGLTEINLSKLLTNVGYSAFHDCSRLSSITLEERTTELVLGECLFTGTALSGEFYLPNNYTLFKYEGGYMSNGPFVGTNISSFKVSDTNTKYMTIDGVLYSRKNTDSSSADFNVPQKLESYPGGRKGDFTLPATIDEIRMYELGNAMYITNIFVEVGNTIFSSVDGILYQNKNTLLCVPQARTNKTITVESNVTSLSSGCMPNHAKEIYLPTGITTIGNTFQTCTELNKIGTIGQTVEEGTFDFTGLTKLTSIGHKGLEYCYGMKKLKVGAKFTSFEDGCFMSAENLEEIYITNTTSVVALKYGTYATTASANFENLTKLTSIYVPADLVDDYQASAYWKPVASKIKALPN